MHPYRAFGLHIASDLELPELAAGDPAAGPDVRIRWGEVPEALAGAQDSGVLFQAALDRFLLTRPTRPFLLEALADRPAADFQA